jgi:hypothetical protein
MFSIRIHHLCRKITKNIWSLSLFTPTRSSDLSKLCAVSVYEKQLNKNHFLAQKRPISISRLVSFIFNFQHVTLDWHRYSYVCFCIILSLWPRVQIQLNFFRKNLLCKVDSLFCQVNFSRQNFLFNNTNENFGGKSLLCKGTRSISL